MKNKDSVLDALDVLNKVNMEYDKFSTDCSHCKIFGTGNVQFSCNLEGYCPNFLPETDKEILKVII
mgnify:CR=1 FL=1